MLSNCMHICYQFEQKPNRKVAWVNTTTVTALLLLT